MQAAKTDAKHQKELRDRDAKHQKEERDRYAIHQKEMHNKDAGHQNDIDVSYESWPIGRFRGSRPNSCIAGAQ